MQRFNDSAEATAFFDQLRTMLNDPRAEEWMKEVDFMHGKNTSELLFISKSAFAILEKELDTAN